MNKKKDKNILIYFEMFILLLGISYFVVSILMIKDNRLFHIINSFLLCSAMILYVVDSFEKDKKIYKILFCTLLGSVFVFNSLNNLNIFDSKEILIDNLTQTSINDLMTWAKSNNIIVEQTYEYSDNVKEFDIISQNIAIGTPLKEVSSIRVVVSLGPNYDKLVIIPDLTGQTIDDVINKKNELFLNNVIINYEVNSDFKKDVVIKQSLKGQYKRNQGITFTISLGKEILPTTMIDLKNKSLFDATLWLKQNGIKYKLNYQFNDIKRDFVISHDIKEGTTVNSNDTVNLIISKGKSIKVPNLLSMNSDDVVKWISENNLKIEFSDKYDTSIPLGTIISANYKENDEIEVGTLIKIVTSKGQLKLPAFSSLADFRSWASTYNIKYNEEYQMNDSVKKGDIIKLSANTGEAIDISANITIYISNGKAVTIPNFYGKSKGDIINLCNNIGLNCSFKDYDYSNLNSGLSIWQSHKAGISVVNGTYISIGLSKGQAKTFTLKINQSSIMDCINKQGCTANYLKQLFSNNYPGVGLTITEKASNDFSFMGNIHEDSPTKDGSSITQGRTYEIIITK